MKHLLLLLLCLPWVRLPAQEAELPTHSLDLQRGIGLLAFASTVEELRKAGVELERIDANPEVALETWSVKAAPGMDLLPNTRTTLFFHEGMLFLIRIDQTNQEGRTLLAEWAKRQLDTSHQRKPTLVGLREENHYVLVYSTVLAPLHQDRWARAYKSHSRVIPFF